MRIRSFLYGAARLIGDVDAIRRGRYLHRVARKAALRGAARIINRLTRG